MKHIELKETHFLLNNSRETPVESLILAYEQERQWIACEVHDCIAQSLTSVFQQLQAMESMIPPELPLRQMVTRCSLLLRDAIRQTRNIINVLHPPVLAELGLIPLIEEELGQLSCGTRLDVNHHARYPREIEVNLYRIFHEALINIQKHAQGVQNVVVSLKDTGSAITLCVQDDGQGFDYDWVVHNKRMNGLRCMQWRCEIMGGTCQITSQTGRGCSVDIYIPVAPVPADQATDTSDSSTNQAHGQPET